MPILPTPVRQLMNMPLGRPLMRHPVTNNPTGYCHEYAFSTCHNDACTLQHIGLDDFKNRVICFKQIKNACRGIGCNRKHASPNQLKQLQKMFATSLLPVVICDQNHATHEEQQNCPYLHLPSSDD